MDSDLKENNSDKSNFKKNCLDILQKANSHVAKISNREIDRMMYDEPAPHDFDDEEEASKEILKESIEELRLRIQYYLERNDLGLLLNQFNSDFSKITGERTSLKFVPLFEYHHSLYLDLLTKYFEAITSDVVVKNELDYKEDFKRLHLKQMLQGTGKLLKDRSILPQNEKEVRKEIYSTLIHFFPDTVREIPISKSSKTYKPDIGIRSLKTAIEYKFATDETQAKTVIGEIYEDIKAYEGSEDWKYFYAVLYMNDNYLTIAQIEADFDAAKISKSHWKPILVIGKGERERRKKKA